jgi:hypothetical protein
LKNEENFQRRKTTVNVPVFATISPQIHHKNTISIFAFSQKPPAKTPFHHARKNISNPSSAIHLPLIGVAADIAVNWRNAANLKCAGINQGLRRNPFIS